MRRVVQTVEMGALPTLRALSEPGLAGGEYFGPSGFQQQRGYPVRVDCSAGARDQATAERLWEVSEKLTDVVYP